MKIFFILFDFYNSLGLNLIQILIQTGEGFLYQESAVGRVGTMWNRYNNNNNNNDLFQTQSVHIQKTGKQNWYQKEYTSADIIRKTNKVHRLDSTHMGTFKNMTY